MTGSAFFAHLVFQLFFHACKLLVLFLLTAAALGPQLLKTYDLGTDADGSPAVLSTERIRAFFFDILSGKVEIQDLDGTFSIEQFARTM